MTAERTISRNRLIYTALLSVCAHLLVLASISFVMRADGKPPAAPPLEVTLSSYQSHEPPEQAEHVAAQQQRGSGSLEQQLAPAVTQQAALPAQRSAPASILPTARRGGSALEVLAISSSDNPALRLPARPRGEQAAQDYDADTTQQIASLRARIKRQRQDYANLPRRQTLSSVASLSAVDAAYLEQWRRQVEMTGNRHYPQQGIFGSLRMMVAIHADGSIAEVQILESSGHRILDASAENIVALAAPFAPFPDTLREQVDILEIIRTWRFHAGSTNTSALGLTP